MNAMNQHADLLLTYVETAIARNREQISSRPGVITDENKGTLGEPPEPAPNCCGTSTFARHPTGRNTLPTLSSA